MTTPQILSIATLIGMMALFLWGRFRYDVTAILAALARRVDYIERFYNPIRRHSTLGYLSPMHFQRQAQLA
ncbi:hypothetical protein Q5H91_06500 [Sphingomonas sp. KR1UV-12]|uniref:Transposase n=1 Tax=Sphingomonas aurea TaxID=3063994 RepID=A0ABT9EJ26_9SPHN|nr:IS3 family transposase [Sphingomonas sp. KR1UV-12]MDP1026855.1 hypothetical protein [Sphingomonas sp. KR1UV-12]